MDAHAFLQALAIALGILAALVIPKIAGSSERARVTAAQADINGGIKSALDQPEFATGIGLVKFGSFQQKKQSGGRSLLKSIVSTIFRS